MKKAGGVIAVIGIILAVMSFMDCIAAIRPWVDLYADETFVSKISSFDMVEADIYAVWEPYATMTTTENGRKTGESAYYIILAFDGDDHRYIGIEVPEKSYSVYDQIMDETYEYLEGNRMEPGDSHVQITGRLKKMNGEMQKYYYEWFTDAGWYESEEEMKAEALPYYIDPVSDPMMSVKFFGFGLITAIVGGVILLFGFLKDKSKEQKAQGQSYVVIGGITYPKQTFAHVNASILGQEKIFAAQEIADITGLSIEEAGEIVEKWNQYYY